MTRSKSFAFSRNRPVGFIRNGPIALRRNQPVAFSRILHSDDWIVTAPFTWTGPTSVAPRSANGLRVRIDAAGRVQARDADGAIVDGIRLHDARGVEVPSEAVRSGVYAWSLGDARGRIAVP